MYIFLEDIELGLNHLLASCIVVLEVQRTCSLIAIYLYKVILFLDFCLLLQFSGEIVFMDNVYGWNFLPSFMWNR
jgi:hypothetical protein